MRSCTWTWIGDSWDKTAGTCNPGTDCPEPSYQGTYTGELATTSCV